MVRLVFLFLYRVLSRVRRSDAAQAQRTVDYSDSETNSESTAPAPGAANAPPNPPANANRPVPQASVEEPGRLTEAKREETRRMQAERALAEAEAAYAQAEAALAQARASAAQARASEAEAQARLAAAQRRIAVAEQQHKAPEPVPAAVGQAAYFECAECDNKASAPRSGNLTRLVPLDLHSSCPFISPSSHFVSP